MLTGLFVAAIASASAAVAPPADDYGYVAWCRGMLGQYIDLHSAVLPEVTRIETAYRAPGSSLAADLKVYADLQTAARRHRLKLDLALGAAEATGQADASARAAAIARGRAAWPTLEAVGARTLAQAWMSWTLPAKCDKIADRLQARAATFARSAPPPRVQVAAAEQPPPARVAFDPISTSRERNPVLDPSLEMGAGPPGSAPVAQLANVVASNSGALDARCRAGNQSSCRVLARERRKSGG